MGYGFEYSCWGSFWDCSWAQEERTDARGLLWRQWQIFVTSDLRHSPDVKSAHAFSLLVWVLTFSKFHLKSQYFNNYPTLLSIPACNYVICSLPQITIPPGVLTQPTCSSFQAIVCIMSTVILPSKHRRFFQSTNVHNYTTYYILPTIELCIYVCVYV